MRPGFSPILPEAVRDAVHSALDTLDRAEHDDRLHTSLALLAAGRFERVRSLLAHATPADWVPLAAARYVAWTGDLRTAAAAWPDIRAALASLLDSDDAALRAASCAELQRTATDLGDPILAASLHRHARGAQSHAPDVRNTPPSDTVANPDHDDVARAADVVLDFVHRSLGVEPDAARHRLRLRPRTFEMPHAVVHAIRFGDAAVDLRWNTDRDGRIRCVVEQQAGAIPVTVLLEPLVAGTVLESFVDDSVAALVPADHAGMTIVPVQLVLDEARSLEIRLAPKDQGPPTGVSGP